ncbi:hypothetical protein CASFOL_040570 [Castilleja foliolosa]|uniref:Uncharacterized protein n=1 Tax=Castilleja foliolosa TaxID=1961234 RepID=A0ABD3BCC7_9LAMI
MAFLISCFNNPKRGNKINDTSVAEARHRLEQQSGEGSEKESKLTRKGDGYYEFWKNTRSVNPTIFHFQ